MTRFPLSGSFPQGRLLILALLAFSACTDGAPPSGVLAPRMALAVGGGYGPTVKSTTPDSATVDSTLNVHVFGSGFDAGSSAQWALNGAPSGKVVTNSTHFVSSTELVANITIAPDAPLASYDVMVTTSSGKGGIGTELFVITAKTTDLGTLGGTQSEALGINNSTQVVGWSYLPSGEQRAFLWTKAGGMQNLGTLGGNSSMAYAINDNGQVAGSSGTPSGETHAFLWTATGGMRDLGTLGGTRSQAFAISQNGAIVGASYLSGGGSEYAFFWSAGVMENLGVPFSEARGVNNAFQIVGFGYPSSPRALLWTKSGGAWISEELVIPNATFSRAEGINELGQVIGGFLLPQNSPNRRGFSWTRAGGGKELPAIQHGVENWAYAVSNAGRIGGWGNDKSGFSPTMWDPTADGWTARIIVKTSRASTWVNAMNDNHQAVGSLIKVTNRHAALWDIP
jgi:probable HAF family extracellular repeat protein